MEISNTAQDIGYKVWIWKTIRSYVQSAAFWCSGTLRLYLRGSPPVVPYFMPSVTVTAAALLGSRVRGNRAMSLGPTSKAPSIIQDSLLSSQTLAKPVCGNVIALDPFAILRWAEMNKVAS